MTETNRLLKVMVSRYEYNYRMIDVVENIINDDEMESKESELMILRDEYQNISIELYSMMIDDIGLDLEDNHDSTLEKYTDSKLVNKLMNEAKTNLYKKFKIGRYLETTVEKPELSDIGATNYEALERTQDRIELANAQKSDIVGTVNSGALDKMQERIKLGDSIICSIAVMKHISSAQKNMLIETIIGKVCQ